MTLLHATAPPEEIARIVGALLDGGRVGAARPLLAALRRLAPGDPAVAVLAARMAMRDGDPGSALAELDGAVAAAPRDPSLRKSRAELRLHLDDRDGAARDAAEAVILDRSDPAAKAVLGITMLELGRTADALACLREAVAAEPGNAAFHEALAAGEEAAGEIAAAAASLAASIAAAPRRAGLRTAAVLLAVRHRDFTRAVALAETARRDGVADACVFGLLGHALSSLGRHAEASEAYAEALKLGPADPYVRHLVSAAGMVPAAGRAPLPYLRAVFDGCADRFERHLLSLGYRVPGLIRMALLRHIAPTAAAPAGPVLDLGCGTGLMGVVLSDLPIGPLTGVDASPGMLAQAARKHLYAELAEAEITDTLRQDPHTWPIMLAADVLCYFGPLESVLEAAFPRLEPGGLFIFSVERLAAGTADGPAGSGWRLGRLGRYAHAPSYVQAAAAGAGFRLLEASEEILRTEADAPVPGLIVVLQRPEPGPAYVH